jgi:hypothetical protein
MKFSSERIAFSCWSFQIFGLCLRPHQFPTISTRSRMAERQRGREAERQRGREAERQRGREAERQRGREAERQRGREAFVQTCGSQPNLRGRRR